MLSPERQNQIRQNLQQVEDRIEKACRRAGRPRDSVTLVIVTKYHDPEDALFLAQEGYRDFGENRVQELTAKMDFIDEQNEQVRWHMIGTLQRNKVKYISGRCQMIHSVNTLRLAQEISKRALANDTKESVLLQVNVTGEDSKHGFTAEEVRKNLDAISNLEGLRLKGLMTMAEADADKTRLRETFGGLRALRDRCKDLLPDEKALLFNDLSMGMTHDFEIAIEEGADYIRLGTAILGPPAVSVHGQ